MILLKVNEAAELLNVSRATMYRLLSERKIPIVKVRGCTRIKEEDINLYVERSTAEANPIVLGKYRRINYKAGMKIV